jgi:Cu2+-exporting ATPase
VAFDKTGTLTEGRFVVSEISARDGNTNEVLAAAAALERSSEHPLADAIVAEAIERGLDFGRTAAVSAVPGHGIEGSIQGRRLRVGRPEWAEDTRVRLGEVAFEALAKADSRGESAVVVMDEHDALGVITLRDKIRDSARQTISELRSMGVTPVMVTGDATTVAETVAAELGIERHYSRVLPQDKARIIGELQTEGPTAFVGDGINDAPALLAADLGVAIGAGTNVAIESADLVLVDDDPSDVVRALRLSQATRRKMVQNLAWATGYNAIALPLAAGVAAWAGILLNPAIGALLMSLSTVIVAVNAMLLRRVDLTAP